MLRPPLTSDGRGPTDPTLPPTVDLYPWADPVVERFGFAPTSQYVEICWLPILGPTSTLLYRRLGSWVQTSAGGLPVDLADLARSFGLSDDLSVRSQLNKSLSRLERFDIAYRSGKNLAVRRAVGALPVRLAARLTGSAESFHRSSIRASESPIATPDIRIVRPPQ